MTYTQTGLHLTEEFEGCVLHSYQDEGGVWTIGYGHTLGVEPGMRCTRTQAVVWLLADVKNAAHYVTCLVHVPLNQGEYNALVDFVFNCGAENFRHSTLLRKLNADDYAGAANEFERWDHVRGKVSAGLLARRMKERAEFLQDTSSPFFEHGSYQGL